ncbi:MAG: tRNA glutamyl-Q(34) synthetase GluQRS [Pseudomonadota bacterium]|nr:tRNA glutamyl-Q(34) synthetase GluQRS [Pseudomonadota bacterium]
MTKYIGRFAPSPTGPLHFGSLVTAVASYLQAQANNGIWLVRIEDIDPPREDLQSKQQILDCLEAHGFIFDRPLLQSTRLQHYAKIIKNFLDNGFAYKCKCSRKILRKNNPVGRNGIIYPGTCRNLFHKSTDIEAVRFLTKNSQIEFNDVLQGKQRCNLEKESGDFLIRRGDGLFSYQLAVAIDDCHQKISQVVRGSDLIDSTFCQIAIFKALKLTPPTYMHTPIAVNNLGEKLSKQTGASTLNLESPEENLYKVLFFLKQNPPNSLRNLTLQLIWEWAINNWKPKNLLGLRAMPERNY